jgi:hypothetical protein
MWITMSGELGIRWKGAIVAYVKALSWCLPGRNEENRKGPQASWYPRPIFREQSDYKLKTGGSIRK